MKIYKHISFLLMALLLTPGVLVLAQEQVLEPIPFASDIATVCRDYYDPTAVALTTEGEAPSAIPGEELTVSAVIENKNQVVIGDAVLVAKVFKQQSPDQKNPAQDIVIDQFVAEESVSVVQGGRSAVSYTWLVPATMEQGEYYIEHALYIGGTTALAGNMVFDGVTIGTVPFVSGGADENTLVRFIKDTAQINGEGISIVSPAAQLGRNDTVTITAQIVNDSTTERTITLQWLQYANHALKSDNLRYSTTESITVLPGETRDISYQLVGQLESRGHVVAQITDGDSKRMLNIPFVRSEGFEIETTFAGLTRFPLTSDSSASLVACVRAPYAEMTPGTRVELTLRDSSGAVLSEYAQDSILLDETVAFVQEFRSETAQQPLTLQVKLLLGGGVLEDYTLTFDCQNFPSDICGQVTTSDDMTNEEGTVDWTQLLLIGGGFFLIILMIVVLYRLQLKRKEVGVNKTSEDQLETPHYE